MPALEKSKSSKKFYTAKVDNQIVALQKEGKSVKEIADAVKHSPASVQYRMSRVLAKKELTEIKYRK